MYYYVISDVDGDVKGVLFHDYSTAYFSVHSKSKALQVAIDTCVKKIKGNRLTRISKNILKATIFYENSPFWADTLVSVLSDGNFWNLSTSGKLGGIAEIDKFLVDNL